MNFETLEKAFEEAKAAQFPICVVLTIPGQEDHEMIINGITSLDNKLAYYKENYDEELRHKRNSEVQIVGAFPIRFFLDEYDKAIYEAEQGK